MAKEEFKDIGSAVEHIEKKMVEYKDAATKEAGEKALTEAKAIVEASEKKAKDEHDKFVKEALEAGATIKTIQDDMKELKAKSGRMGTSGQVAVKGLRQIIMRGIEDGIREHKSEIISSEGGELMKTHEIKAVGNVASANLSGDNYISYLDWRPGMEPTGQFHFRNLVRTILSETDFVQFPRANTPIGEGSFGRTAEAATKPQIDRDYTMINLTLKAMAAYIICSRQSLRNIIFLQSWLPTSMMEQMEDSEDTDFANTLVAAATGSTSTTGITNGTSTIGKLVAYIKNNIAAKYNPGAIAMDPAVWANLILNTETNAGYNLPNIVTVSPTGTVMILGRPTYPVNWLTGGRVLMGDWSKVAIVQSEGLRFRQSDSHASIFTSNEIAFLLERTEGLAVFRPDAFITAVV